MKLLDLIAKEKDESKRVALLKQLQDCILKREAFKVCETQKRVSASIKPKQPKWSLRSNGESRILTDASNLQELRDNAATAKAKAAKKTKKPAETSTAVVPPSKRRKKTGHATTAAEQSPQQPIPPTLPSNLMQ